MMELSQFVIQSSDFKTFKDLINSLPDDTKLYIEAGDQIADGIYARVSQLRPKVGKDHDINLFLNFHYKHEDGHLRRM